MVRERRTAQSWKARKAFGVSEPRFLFCEVGCESSRTGWLLVTWRRTTPAVP